jgi:hypothetical protein
MTCGARVDFAYSPTTPGYITTTYYDRRGSAWTYRFNDSWQNLNPDGNLNWIADPTEVYYGFYYDTNRNLTDITVSNSNNWAGGPVAGPRGTDSLRAPAFAACEPFGISILRVLCALCGSPYIPLRLPAPAGVIALPTENSARRACYYGVDG